MVPFDGAVPAAGTYLYDLPGTPIRPRKINYSVNFDITTLGGTTVDNYLQTSFDNGVTWEDVANLQVLQADVRKIASMVRDVAAAVRTAASDGALAADTKVDGLMGYNWRIKQVVVGAYNADSRLKLTVNFLQ